jgi:hypothetical protein
MRKIHVLLLLGVEAVLLCAGVAVASRNSSGTMSAINGPYVAGTVISATTVNARLADIETELTDSASRSGKGGFTAPVKAADGSNAAPAFTFTSDPDSGVYRGGANDVRIAVGGADAVTVTATAITLASKASLASGGTPVAITPNASITAGSGLAYWKDVSGTVHIKGTINNATGGPVLNLITGANALPAGFRPSFARAFACTDSSTNVYHVTVSSVGAITSSSVPNGTTVYLDCVSYLAEA